MRWILKAYETILHRYPVVIQSAQTGILVAAGDVLAQLAVEKQKKLNYLRTLKFFCVGAFYVGPALTVWYRVLDKYVGSGGKSQALKKVFCDQAFFAPICLAGFILVISILQGKSGEEIKAMYTDTYPDILIANYKMWPAAQLINFYFVPLHYQVLYVQCLALLWNVYLCYKTKPADD